MKTLPLTAALLLATALTPAFAADMTSEERADLRARAAALRSRPAGRSAAAATAP